MNYYLRKRLHNHIKRSDMARMLGVDYNFYYAIEKGDVKMPINLINKFNEIINKGEENKISEIENDIKADEFWKEVSTKNTEGKWVLVDKMHEFNIHNYEQLAHLIGYRSVGTIYNYLQGRNVVGKEFKKRLYNFFSDETNIQIPTKIERKKYTKAKEVNRELDAYFKNTDFKKILSENKITNRHIANATGYEYTTISKMTSKKSKPSYAVIGKVKQYLEDVLSEPIEGGYEIKTTPSKAVKSREYISKQKLIEGCEKEIEENNSKVAELQKQIDEINAKTELTKKFIAMVNALQ